MNYRFGLIGYPIKHSLSPWIHEQFFKRTDLDGTYSIFEIEKQISFAEEMKKLRKIKLDGFNVTVPYKVKIIDFLDEMDEQAKQIGAVNTVLCKNGKWIGYNTDGIGYMRSLLSYYPDLDKSNDKRILILGSGGAAKGIFYALIHNGYRNITIANRSMDKAKQLSSNVPSGVAISLQQAEQTVNHYDLIIQTTSVGMKPNENSSIIPLRSLKENAIVSDIVYQPIMTAFLKEADALHSNIHLGHTMLLYQAQYAFEIWTGKRPKMEELDQALQKILEG